jgi:hypothetical protein
MLVKKLNLGKKDKHPIKSHGCFDNKTSLGMVHLTFIMSKQNGQTFFL